MLYKGTKKKGGIKMVRTIVILSKRNVLLPS